MVVTPRRGERNLGILRPERVLRPHLAINGLVTRFHPTRHRRGRRVDPRWECGSMMRESRNARASIRRASTGPICRADCDNRPSRSRIDRGRFPHQRRHDRRVGDRDRRIGMSDIGRGVLRAVDARALACLPGRRLRSGHARRRHRGEHVRNQTLHPAGHRTRANTTGVPTISTLRMRRGTLSLT